MHVSFKKGTGALFCPIATLFTPWAQRKQEIVPGRKMEVIKTTDLHDGLLTPAIQTGVMMKDPSLFHPSHHCLFSTISDIAHIKVYLQVDAMWKIKLLSKSDLKEKSF